MRSLLRKPERCIKGGRRKRGHERQGRLDRDGVVRTKRGERMRNAFRRRYTCTFGQGCPEPGWVRAVHTMANRRSGREIFARGLNGGCELVAGGERRWRFRRTCILLREWGGHLRRGLVDDESKLMLQINGGGKNRKSISAGERYHPLRPINNRQKYEWHIPRLMSHERSDRLRPRTREKKTFCNGHKDD